MYLHTSILCSSSFIFGINLRKIKQTQDIFHSVKYIWTPDMLTIHPCQMNVRKLCAYIASNVHDETFSRVYMYVGTEL